MPKKKRFLACVKEAKKLVENFIYENKLEKMTVSGEWTGRNEYRVALRNEGKKLVGKIVFDTATPFVKEIHSEKFADFENYATDNGFYIGSIKHKYAGLPKD